MEANEINSSRTISVDMNDEMQKAFIAYSMAVIINRALPDVRDGLKPVQRRILFAMDELGMDPAKPTKKSVRIVGETMGKYHPHGDSSIYEALVHMAQKFSMRYPLVDGQGNFGSVDGDGAAAMRYTEARFARIAVEMLRDIDKDTVDFMPNFDGLFMQPMALPSHFPNILVNGSGGIAVGMATKIPPHNLGETIDACVALIDDADLSIDGIMKYLPGPDFPTGGIIYGLSGVQSAYRTGAGRIRLRAKTEIETYKGDQERIVVTEIPYQVNKAELVARIAELAQAKIIEGIADLRDESDKSGMRISIELKRGVNSAVVLNRLFKHTKLQDTFGVRMLALVNGEPRTLNIKEVLVEYLKHQEEVITRRTRFDLDKALKRAHIVEGLLHALDVIEEIIKLIRGSKDANEARRGLMEDFGFSEVQAQAILDMRLQRLTGLEKDKLDAEYAKLQDEIAYYNRILGDRNEVLGIIKADLLDIKARYSDDRRTQITASESDIDLDELIEEDEMVVTMTHRGYIKRMSSSNYKAQRRGGRGITGLQTKEEDYVEDVFVTSTHNQLLFFTDQGRVFIKKCYQIPESGRQSKGAAIVNHLQLRDGEKISSLLPVSEFNAAGNLMMITKNGIIKKTSIAEFANIRQNGLIALGIREGDELMRVLETTGNDKIMLCTKQGMGIVFDENDVREMGRTATGVRGIKLRDGDCVIGAAKLSQGAYVLVVTENGYGKRTPVEEFRVQTRGGMGLKTISVTDKTGFVSGMVITDEGVDVILINDANVIIRMSVAAVSIYSRAAQGVRVMRMEDGAKVVGMALLDEDDEDDEAALTDEPQDGAELPASEGDELLNDLDDDEAPLPDDLDFEPEEKPEEPEDEI